MLYRQAGDSGEGDALARLALMQAEGRGGPQDVAAGFATAQRSSEVGGPLGLFTLGQFYEFGQGVAANPAQARALYTQAADLGLEAAKERLALLDAAAGPAAPVRRYGPEKLDN